MNRVLLAIEGCLLVLLAAACENEGPRPTPQAQDPQVLVSEALSTMGDLRSYRLEMLFAGAKEQPLVIEFAEPDSYHFLIHAVQADEIEESEGVYEAIMVGDKAYTRQCRDIEKACDPWRQGPRPPVPIAAPSPSFAPGWPLVALEMAHNLQTIGSEEIDGVPATHLRGAANQLRAALENERRILTAAGITTFGEECEGRPGGREECRELTFEEALVRQEPDLSFYDENPSTIDAWVREDGLVLRIALAIPPHDTGVTVEYSRFNEVTIEPPE
jgi:hypothetical protein